METSSSVIDIFLIALYVLACIAFVIAVVRAAAKYRALHVEQNEGPLCASCRAEVDEYTPWQCAGCMEYFCSEPCQERHKFRAHRVSKGRA